MIPDERIVDKISDQSPESHAWQEFGWTFFRTTEHPDGTFQYPEKQPGGGTLAYRKQLGYLKKFMDSFEFVEMKPDTTVFSGEISGKNKVIVLSEPGKQYAIYWMGGQQVNPEFNLPAGNYRLEWMNPITGKTQKQRMDHHQGGMAQLGSPIYQEDMALRIIQK